MIQLVAIQLFDREHLSAETDRVAQGGGRATLNRIPEFTIGGLLPPVGPDVVGPVRSPYLVSMQEVVRRLGNSPRRRHLLRNLLAYRALLRAGGFETGLQFLDGSFVENVESHSGREPGDIDVYSLLDIPPRYLQDPALWQTQGYAFWRDEVQNRRLNKQRFALDTYATLIQELSFFQLIENVIYWYSLFSHQKVTFAWKGFVAVSLDETDDHAALSMVDALDGKPTSN